MIQLHKLRGDEFWLNHRLIETIEAGSDTRIVLTNEKKYIVKESPEEILHLVQQFEHRIFRGDFPVQDDRKK